MDLIDFKLDYYDYATFLILLLVVIAFFYAMVTLGGLPGKLAEKRKHPHAESVKLGGWIGLFTVFPWIHALIWAYHDSLTIDIRRLPKDMRDKLDEDHDGEEATQPGAIQTTVSEIEAADVPPQAPKTGPAS
ncbi:DUF3302 domain-containing protein [uncultured Roseibium sp.]|uniref:DUF3302 domain-containing protein n=1 Tax=uncultured Roseibium sp. TaxID=1936171 RepID=UPI0026286ACD|nr:DUF3302 domain-containing protein [uncultured Roseibium sp.]